MYTHTDILNNAVILFLGWNCSHTHIHTHVVVPSDLWRGFYYLFNDESYILFFLGEFPVELIVIVS